MVSVRSSKYRHVYGDPTRKDKCYDNIRLTKNAFDANLAKSNGKYISLNWDASGGGSFAVIPTAEQGKLPDRFPLFDGHRGPVLDTDWNPFDDQLVVSASEDGTIGIWKVPEDFSVHVDYGKLDDCEDIKPVKFLEGHGKKVGHVNFNPVASNVLASASLDNNIKIWDIETGEVLFNLKHPAFVTSFSWNYDGTKIASVAKDRVLRIWDVRAEKIISEGKGHAGAKGSRVVWLGDSDRVLTTGFSLVSDREMALWDVNDISKGPIGGFRGLDPSSGIVIPHYDPMTSMIYLGGRGDGKIVYYELDEEDNLYDLFAYNSTSPQRGLGWVPNRSLNPGDHEVARVYKVHENLVEPISFKVPLKNEGFLDNVYKIVEAGVPALTAKEWKEGKTKRPLVKDWKEVYEGKDSEVKESPKSEAKPETPKTEAKSETPKETAKETAKEPKSVPKSEPKSEPRSEPKSETKLESKTKSEEVAALEKAEKQDSYDVLQSDDVKKFLAKNTQEDEEPSDHEADEDSAWGEEKPTKRDAAESKAASTKEAKQATPKEATPAKEEAKQSAKEASTTPAKKSASLAISEKEDAKTTVIKTVTKETTKQTKDGEVSESSTKVSSTPATPSSSSPSSSQDSKFDLILQRLDELTNRISKLEASVKK